MEGCDGEIFFHGVVELCNELAYYMLRIKASGEDVALVDPFSRFFQDVVFSTADKNGKD